MLHQTKVNNIFFTQENKNNVWFNIHVGPQRLVNMSNGDEL